jgi:hypothetical protein
MPLTTKHLVRAGYVYLPQMLFTFENQKFHWTRRRFQWYYIHSFTQKQDHKETSKGVIETWTAIFLLLLSWFGKSSFKKMCYLVSFTECYIKICISISSFLYLKSGLEEDGLTLWNNCYLMSFFPRWRIHLTTFS